MILCIRSDKPEAELYVYVQKEKRAEVIWHAHRTLSVDILQRIEQVLADAEGQKHDISGLIVFQGPGSFTGLRIGINVANTIADKLTVPVVGTQGDNWIAAGLERLENGEDDQLVLPEYGGDANITRPRK